MRERALRGGRLLLSAIAAFAVVALRCAPAATLPPHPVTASLVAEARGIAPGGTLWVDLHLVIAEGWHVYWRNPGDSGLPTEIAWQLPPGFGAGDIAWPAPERFVLGTIGNYGYTDAADLLVPITAPLDLPLDRDAHLAADANWLVCSDICIPGEAKLALDLPVSAAATADPAVAPLFAAARGRLPQPARFAARFDASPSALRLLIPSEAIAGVDNPRVEFFPLKDGLVDVAKEPTAQPRNDGIELTLPRLAGPKPGAVPATLDGVLVVHGAGGVAQAYSVAAAPGAISADSGAGIRWWQALLLALLGGLLLNLMPCVFPILSLKVLGLTGLADRGTAWRHGAAYAGGVLCSFALLGVVLLLLRAGGAAIGWGFQLQSPVIVALLAYLLFAMGLSLSGVADFGMSLAGIGSGLTHRSGQFGAFATGVLATIVATPCSAPFMGTALGFALVSPALLALAIFLALGIGLALPFALAAMLPPLRRVLPRPGVWMDWFKQFLAFPLYATVVWLIWVLIQQVGSQDAFAALLGLVAVGFAVWVYGRTRYMAETGRRIGGVLAAAGLAAAVLLAGTMTVTVGSAASSSSTAGGLPYEPFSPERLARLEADHRPVFVNLTAAWCITCLVNERTALDSAAVRAAFVERGIVALKGDWTRQDPMIAAFLQQFGRSGVPLYLLYDRTGSASVLPQILTEASVLAAVGKI